MVKKTRAVSKKSKTSRDVVLDTLYKKGVGYIAEEVVEEYASEEKGGELLKRKITKKSVPPDVSALKTYLEYTRATNDYDNMSDVQIQHEKIRLIKLLKAGEDKYETGKSE